MSIEQITQDDSGMPQSPLSAREWDGWVSASRTRNYVLDNPLLDWLDRFGESKGFVADRPDERTDFDRFVADKGREFEAAVVEHLRSLGIGEVFKIGSESPSPAESQSLDLAVETWEAMAAGAEIIAQGVLRDPEHRTYGRPDLLVRSDALATLFPEALSVSKAAVPGPDLGIGDVHYVVVDIKFTTLNLLAGGGLSNSGGSSLSYKVQLHIYNRALGRLQGYLPPRAFLLGRGWKKGNERGDSCMDLLAPVEHNEQHKDLTLSDRANQAAQWLREMRRTGHLWEALPEASVDELRPDAAGNNGRWAGAVKGIVEETGDLTVLWQVGAAKRRNANSAGIETWQDPLATPERLGVGGPKQSPVLQALLDVNRSAPSQPGQGGESCALRPAHVAAARSQWHETPPLEFFVDFETVNDLDDDFSNIPHKGGQPLIFMIGCGHIEDGGWRFECFIADQLTEADEAIVIADWVDHMANTRARLAPQVDPKVIHWSSAEQSSLETAYNSAVARHPQHGPAWAAPNWFDLLKTVARAEPVVVKGAFGFGLKEMTNAMHSAGLIPTKWADGPADGRGAMVGAWSCQREVDQGRAERLIDTDLMQQIGDYNETDCKAIHDILQYLRQHH